MRHTLASRGLNGWWTLISLKRPIRWRRAPSENILAASRDDPTPPDTDYPGTETLNLETREWKPFVELRSVEMHNR